MTTATSTSELVLDPRLGSAIATTERPARASALSASLTFGWRAIPKVKHVPEQLGDVIGIPIIFTLLFTYLFGGALAGSTSDYLWATLGLLMRAPSAVMNMNTGMLVLFPLTFASNAFVDSSTLPGWLRGFVHVNPITHLVTAERALMNGTATAAEITWVLIAIAALTAVFAPLTMRIYQNKQ